MITRWFVTGATHGVHQEGSNHARQERGQCRSLTFSTATLDRDWLTPHQTFTDMTTLSEFSRSRTINNCSR